ncbi:MAG TPA: Rieske 2Fe-2S domain-containing protein [Coriobacteriia bacterium]|nr:Rieske 2Fe-2S domain-containing protein [Coriobacteriia bacterium]
MTERGVRRVFETGTTIDDLKAYMGPFAERLGYKFNTETDFVDEVLASEIEILERDGDVYCPCRIRTGDPKEDLKIVCPCIPFYRDHFAAISKCWCGLFILQGIEDGAELIGVLDDPAPGTPIEVPVARLEDLPDGAMRHVKVGKNDVAIARTGDEVFALSNVCRHAFGPLAEGFVDGYFAVCPWHGWRYDLRDGTTDHPNADVRTYDVRIRDGLVYVVAPFAG